MSKVGTGSAGVRHALQKKTRTFIILDLGLPDMDGIEVIRQIRESSQVADYRRFRPVTARWAEYRH